MCIITIGRRRLEIDCFTFLLSEESVVRAEPGSILWITLWIIWVSTETGVRSDDSKVLSWRMNDCDQAQRNLLREWSVLKFILREERGGNLLSKTCRSYASLTRGTMTIRPYPACLFVIESNL